MTEKEKAYHFLKGHKIAYRVYEHESVYTVQDAKNLNLSFAGTQCKNLFLKNKKGNRYYLVILEENERVELSELCMLLNESRLSFASEERLYAAMKVEPGAVGLLGLINDVENQVDVVLGRGLQMNDSITFHPNSNDATVSIKSDDFEKILAILEKRVTRL